MLTDAASGAGAEWHALKGIEAAVRVGALETFGPEYTGLVKVPFVVAHCKEAHNDSGALGHLCAICAGQ